MYNGGNLADLYLKSDNVQNTFYEIPEGVFVNILQVKYGGKWWDFHLPLPGMTASGLEVEVLTPCACIE